MVIRHDGHTGVCPDADFRRATKLHRDCAVSRLAQVFAPEIGESRNRRIANRCEGAADAENAGTHPGERAV
jgi:hypothetical protein